MEENAENPIKSRQNFKILILWDLLVNWLTKKVKQGN
jgi:hypothetical protein